MFKIILDDVVILYSFKLGLKEIDNHLFKYTFKVDKLSDYLLSDFNTLTLPIFLKADDGNSMAHGVETRLPFMDYRIVNLGLSIPENFKIGHYHSWVVSKINFPEESYGLIKLSKFSKSTCLPSKSLSVNWADIECI